MIDVFFPCLNYYYPLKNFPDKLLKLLVKNGLPYDKYIYIYIFAKAIVFILGWVIFLFPYLRLISSAMFLNSFIHVFVNFFILQGMFWSSSSSQRCWVRMDKEVRIFIFSCALFGWFVLIHCCSFLWIRAVMGMVTLGNIMSQILSGRVTPESPIVKCIYKNFKKVK